MPKLDDFTRAYIDAALWSSVDNDGHPLDGLGIDLSDDARAEMARQCADFQRDNLTLLDEARDDEHMTDAQLGHDFWLTRNGHGAGYWSRGMGDELAQALTRAAHKMGEADLYVSDAGTIEHTSN